MTDHQQLHKTYCDDTGLHIRLDAARERSWYDFLQAGFTKEDLELVIKYLKKGIARGERNEGCLRFRNLVVMLDYFEEELAMARKAANIRQRPAAAPQQRTVALPNGDKVSGLVDAPAPPVDTKFWRAELERQAANLLRKRQESSMRGGMTENGS
jgi:hypothetical protein